MRKLLIVDDERIEREGIKMLLKKMNADLDIIEAGNGKQACKILEEQEIDLLLTDIKMPFMSGIELVRVAREKNKHMPIAIFSGFGEFTYAQEAIKYDVTDYILKPVKPKEFQETITRMLEKCRSIEARRAEQQNRTDFVDKYLLQKYLFTGKEKYMHAMLQTEAVRKGTESIKDIQNMMLLDTDRNFFEENGAKLIPRIQTVLNRKVEYLDLNTQEMLLFFFKSATDNYLRIAGVISDLIEKEYGVKCYIAVSRKLHAPEEYPAAYQELELQMENKFYYTDQNVFRYYDEEEKNSDSQQKTDYQSIIRENIKMKDITHLWDSYKKLVLQIKRESMNSQMYMKFIFSEIVKELFDEMQADGSEEMRNQIESVYQAGSLEEICKITEECIQKFEKWILESEQGARSDIDQVKQYIQYHVDEDLSIDKLAAMVYLSQGYLSYVFKKETGMNLSRYIRQCRMEKAKELLKETNMKIVQICEKVGFSNVSYFCQSFREYCGVSPDKYRKGEGADEDLD